MSRKDTKKKDKKKEEITGEPIEFPRITRQIQIQKPDITIIISSEDASDDLDELMQRALYILDEYGIVK